MTFNTIELLSFFVVFLFLFFAGYLLTVKTNKKLSNILFASYLIVTALDASAFFYHKFLTVSYTAEMLRTQILSGLKEPLFYLYLLSVVYDNFRLKPIHLLLLIPIGIDLVVLFPNFFNVSIAEQKLFYDSYHSQVEIKFIRSFGYMLQLAYFVAEIYQVVRYRKIVKQNYSNANALLNYEWLKQFLIIITIGSLITLIKGIQRFKLEDSNVVNNWRIFMLLFGVAFISWLFSKALIAPKIFKGIDASLLPIQEQETDTTIEDERIQQVKNFMQTEEPYLDASLTLQKLAHQLQMPSRELSVLINQQIGKHFFDFVNEYRIEKAKELLSDVSEGKLTVLEILYEVGFNSKSSFNTAFKKYTGSTPTQYRKSNS